MIQAAELSVPYRSSQVHLCNSNEPLTASLTEESGVQWLQCPEPGSIPPELMRGHNGVLTQADFRFGDVSSLGGSSLLETIAWRPHALNLAIQELTIELPVSVRQSS